MPRAKWDFKQWTNGWGTKAAFPGEKIDRATADQRLQTELSKAATLVDRLGVPMTAGQRNALISLTYNAGPGWMRAGLGNSVRRGDWDGARRRLLSYNKAGGRVNQWLVTRRLAEAQLMMQPDTAAR